MAEDSQVVTPAEEGNISETSTLRALFVRFMRMFHNNPPTTQDSETPPEQRAAPMDVVIPQGTVNLRANDNGVLQFCEVRYLSEHEKRRRDNGYWSSKWQALMPTLSCILGAFSICRLAEQIILYKGPFVVQFLLLSLLLGCPALVMMVTFGQYMGSGMIGMWFISPAFRGIGIALMFTYVWIGLYSTLPLSWLHIFMADSAVSNKGEYRWANCSSYASEDQCPLQTNCTVLSQVALNLESYMKHCILEVYDKPGTAQFSINKTISLAFLWFLVFLTVRNGLKFYGWVIFVMNLLNCFLFWCLTFKFLFSWGSGVFWLFDTSWKRAMLDPMHWARTLREVFLTWNLFGGMTMHLCSHIRSRGKLGRYIVCLLLLITVMLLGVILFSACLGYALHSHGATFHPIVLASDKNVSSAQRASLLYSRTCETSADAPLTFVSYLSGDSFISKQNNLRSYTVLRVATELFPGLVAVEGSRNIPPILPVLFYFSIIFFGFSQLATIWMCLGESIYQIQPKIFAKWKSFISFFLTCFPFVMGLPFTMQATQSVVHFFDFCLSSIWWELNLFACMVVVVIAVKGHPYDVHELLKVLVKNLKTRAYASRVLTIIWGYFLPLMFMFMSALFMSDDNLGVHAVWPKWPIEANYFVLVFETSPLIIFLSVMIFECFRFMCRKKGFKRNLQDFFCPVYPLVPVLRYRSCAPVTSNEDLDGLDPPPPYTPPPSYSLAIGRAILAGLSRSRSEGDIEMQDLRAKGNTGNTRLSTAVVNRHGISILETPCPSSSISHDEARNLADLPHSSTLRDATGSTDFNANSDFAVNQNQISEVATTSGLSMADSSEAELGCGSSQLECSGNDVNWLSDTESLSEGEINYPLESSDEESSEEEEEE